MFICTKAAIDKRHQFGLITLLNSAAWTHDLTTSKEDVIRDLRQLDPIDVQDIFDLTTLFATVQSRVKCVLQVLNSISVEIILIHLCSTGCQLYQAA